MAIRAIAAVEPVSALTTMSRARFVNPSPKSEIVWATQIRR